MDKKKTKMDGLIPTFTRPNESKSKLPLAIKNHKLKSFKPIIIASISAIVIGSVLGIVMLNMFTNIDDIGFGNNNQSISATQMDEDDKSSEAVKTEKMSAYVLQVGAFSGKENAEEWKQKYTDAGYPTVIWARENQHFLIAGITSEKELADPLVSELKQKGFDVYVKEWVTDAKEINVTNDAKEWLLLFQDQWNKTLQAGSIQSKDVANWQELLEKYPNNATELTHLQKTIEEHFEKLDGANERETEHILLDIWLNYDKTLN